MKIIPKPNLLAFVAALALSGLAAPALSQQSSADLAKKLSNPVAALISVPLQLNFDDKIGPTDSGKRTLLNLQPVVPIPLDQNWNLISRTILPVVSQQDIFPGAGSQSGIGDIVQSVFFSPKAPTTGGWIWGAGPVFLLPTGSDDLLSAKKWGAGPTAVLLKQEHGWTYGALANHISSFAGDSARAAVSTTFLQPFLSHTTPTAWTYGASTESSYNWKSNQWAVPLILSVSKVTKIDSQLMSVGGSVRYWAASPDSGPQGWGFRFDVTLLFPE
ncbi:MAG: transporter [Rhodoferax sp.]